MITITQALNEYRLQAVVSFLDTGTANARLRIYSGTRPASPLDAPTQTPLAEVVLTKPCGSVANGQLTLTQEEDGLILQTGIATWARLVSGNGTPACDMDCSDTNGTGEVRLSQTNLYAGGAVRLLSVVLG